MPEGKLYVMVNLSQPYSYTGGDLDGFEIATEECLAYTDLQWARELLESRRADYPNDDIRLFELVPVEEGADAD